MGKISQSLAESISRKVVQKIGDEMVKVEKQIEDIVKPLYIATIPVDVMKAFKKNPEWFKKENYVYISGPGINNYYRSVNLGEHYPHNGKTRYDLEPKVAGEIVKLEQKKEKLKDKKNQTQREIESTLLSLGTTKRILEQLPQLAEYLPVQGNTSLMFVPSAIREKIACLVNAEDTKCIETI